MLKPVKVLKIAVIGPKEHLEGTTEILHRLNAVHVEALPEEEYFKVCEPFERASTVSKSLVQLRGFLAHLKIDPTKVEPTRKYRLEEIKQILESKLEEYQKEIGEKLEKIKNLKEKQNELKDELRIIEPLKILGIPPRLLKDYKNLACFIGFTREDPTSRIREVTADYEVVIKEHKKNLYMVAIFVRKEFGDEVFRILQDFGYQELPVPDIEDYEERTNEINGELTKIEGKLQTLQSEIDSVKEREAETMLAIEEYLSIDLDKAELPLECLSSKYTFVLTGYVPAKEFEKVKNEIESETNGKVVVESLEEVDRMAVPIKLENPKGMNNFELLTKTFGVPKYTEVDPTLIISIFLPFFFGFMLGDVGYGIVIFTLAWIAKKKLKTEGWQKMFNMAMIAAVVAIVFGIIYGEFFGPFLQAGEPAPHFLWPVLHSLGIHHIHPLIDRTEAHWIKWLIVTTVVLGLFKIISGWLLGFRNLYVEHGFKEAFLEKGVWVFGMAMIGCVIFGFIYNKINGILPVLPIPGQEGWQNGLNIFYLIAPVFFVIWFVIFVLMNEVKKMGGIGVLMTNEILMMVSQTMSYARLLAIGLSSVYIAYVINLFGYGKALAKGGVFLAIGIFILLLGHMVNTILGVFDPGIQGVRLHYVEFFTKFFEGGGREFVPFGRRKKFLEEVK
jgi:V/A-type H+-transporting ATPase subunit I